MSQNYNVIKELVTLKAYFESEFNKLRFDKDSFETDFEQWHFQYLMNIIDLLDKRIQKYKEQS